MTAWGTSSLSSVQTSDDTWHHITAASVSGSSSAIHWRQQLEDEQTSTMWWASKQQISTTIVRCNKHESSAGRNSAAATTVKWDAEDYEQRRDDEIMNIHRVLSASSPRPVPITICVRVAHVSFWRLTQQLQKSSCQSTILLLHVLLRRLRSCLKSSAMAIVKIKKKLHYFS